MNLENDINRNKHEVESFFKEGWLRPYKLLDKGTIDKITAIYYKTREEFTSSLELFNNNEISLEKKPWFKSMHLREEAIKKIALDEIILEKVKSLLGQKIIAWGGTIVERLPGQKHRWHIDIEHLHWKGITVFIGLKGIRKESSIILISQSNRINEVPQRFKFSNTSEVLKYCKKHNTECEVIQVEINEGDFFIFDGLTWHSSENLTSETRLALILQYALDGSDIRIPCNWDEPIKWHKQVPGFLKIP